MVQRRVYLKRRTKPIVSNYNKMLLDELKMPSKLRYKIINTLNLYTSCNYTQKEIAYHLENKVK